MGYVYSELIPPAVLLDNPGLTRDQFIKKLQEVRYSGDRTRDEIYEGNRCSLLSVLRNFPLDLRGCSSLRSFMTQNPDFVLYKVANILSLKNNPEFDRKMISMGREDKLCNEGRVAEIYGDEIVWGVPSFSSHPDLEEPLFDVYTNGESYLTGRRQFGRFRRCSSEKEGNVVLWTETGARFYPFRIKRFAKNFGEEQLMEIEEIEIPRKHEEFHTLDRLLKAHPYFHPEFMYDFSQVSGEINCDYRFKGFKWKKELERYFLDWETFRNIEGVSSDDAGEAKLYTGSYTDLILTAEAIRHRAWKLLSAYGLAYLDDFLKQFPDAKKRYELAVEDAFHLLPSLKKGNMTPEEFVRMSKSFFYESK